MSMTKWEVETLARMGTKGQIVLKKDVRTLLGVHPGSLLKVSATKHEGKIEPVKNEDMIAEVERIARMVSKHIRKGRTSVDIIRDQRD